MDAELAEEVARGKLNINKALNKAQTKKTAERPRMAPQTGDQAIWNATIGPRQQPAIVTEIKSLVAKLPSERDRKRFDVLFTEICAALKREMRDELMKEANWQMDQCREEKKSLDAWRESLETRDNFLSRHIPPELLDDIHKLIHPNIHTGKFNQRATRAFQIFDPMFKRTQRGEKLRLETKKKRAEARASKKAKEQAEKEAATTD